MGIFLSKIWNRLFGEKNQFKILILGLGNAGKTTLLYQLHLGEVVNTQPTIGSNVEEVVHKNVKLQVWDVGGQETLRKCWASYFIEAIIFVVDSSDKKNHSLSKLELDYLIKHEDLKNVVFLIFANKQDLANSMNPSEICDFYELNKIQNHSWHIQGCSGLTKQGISDGMGWLTNKILENKK